MKNLTTMIIICLAIIYGCKEKITTADSNLSTTLTKTKKSSGKIENFECAAFFEKGEYSSMCFTDSKLPEYINRGCIFDFVTKGNKQEQSIKIQFARKGSASLAEMSFNLTKSNYKKGKLKDISNIGDAAFFDIHGTDLKSLSRSNKDLHVLHENITFVLMAEYLTSKEAPCFYDDKEMIAFAENIISNM